MMETFDKQAAYRAVERLIQLSHETGIMVHVEAAVALHDRYGVDAETLVMLGEAAGTCPDALALLDNGLPVEYVLAMGRAR